MHVCTLVHVCTHTHATWMSHTCIHTRHTEKPDILGGQSPGVQDTHTHTLPERPQSEQDTSSSGCPVFLLILESPRQKSQ